MRPQVKLSDFDRVISNRGYEAQATGGFQPRKDQPAYELRLPLNWDIDPFGDRNWCFQLHAWRMLPPIWGRYLQTRDVRVLHEALAYICDWHRHGIGLRNDSAFMWYDMATGIRAQHLALVRWILLEDQIQIAEGVTEVLDGLVELHLNKLRDPKFLSEGNHGIFQIHGLQLLSVLNGDHERDSKYVHESLSRLLSAQFTSQFVHTENSPYYHGFAISVLSALRQDLFPESASMLAAALDNAQRHLPWFIQPDGAYLNVGDSEGRPHRAPQWREIPRPDVIAADGVKYISHDLTASGYAIARTHPSVKPGRACALYFVGSNFMNSHSHADELSFVYFHRGAPLLIDSGKYTYNKGEWRDHFVSDRAHNLATLKDVVFGPADTRTSGSALRSFKWTQGRYRMDGQVRRGKDFRHTRVIFFEPEKRIVVRDEVLSTSRSARFVLFHLAPDIQVNKKEGYVDLLRSGRVVARLRPRGALKSIEVVSGVSEARPIGWFSQRYRARVPAPVVCVTYAHDVDLMETEIRFR